MYNTFLELTDPLPFAPFPFSLPNTNIGCYIQIIKFHVITDEIKHSALLEWLAQ